jgi:rod shape-determining protein MreD
VRVSRRVRLPAAVLVALIVQTCLLQRIRIDGTHADAMLLVAVAAGIAGGAEIGALTGFAVGLVADLFLQTPLGLSALAYCVIGFGVGALQSSVLRTTAWVVPLTAFLASAAGVALFAVAGAVVGQPNLVGPRLPLIAAIVGALNAVIAIPFVGAIRWAMADEGARAYAR